MTKPSPAEIARLWWSAIDRSDFHAAASLLAPETSVEWPLSNERMESAADWTLVNEHYPGKWSATIDSLVADGDIVVTTTTVTDGGISVLAISWFTVTNGLITRLVEYWPETYAAPGWRSQWTVPIQPAEGD